MRTVDDVVNGLFSVVGMFIHLSMKYIRNIYIHIYVSIERDNIR